MDFFSVRHFPKSNSIQQKTDRLPLTLHPHSMTWPSTTIGFRSCEDEKEPVSVLYVPYEHGEVDSRPVSWYFVLDASASMNTQESHLLTRWTLSLKLLSRLLSDLKAAQRTQDIVTLVTFNSRAKTRLREVPLLQVPDLDTLLEHVHPRGHTDMGKVFQRVSRLMSSSPNRKTHRVAEIFCTDGHATRGETDSKALCNLKTELYRELSGHGDQPETTAPFLWCGALGREADWQLLQAISKSVSPYSLWAYLRTPYTYAEEISLVKNTVLHARRFQLNGTTQILMPETANVFYLDQPSPQKVQVELVSPTLVKLHRNLDQLYRRGSELSSDELNHMALEVANIFQKQDTLVSSSELWFSHLESLRAQALNHLFDLQNPRDDQALYQQRSTFRDSILSCKPVLLDQDRYKHIVVEPRILHGGN